MTAVAVTVAVLAPLAAPGYVLINDMVFVPHQPLRAELIAPSATLPRAVPLDALVSLATQLVPGWLVQRLVLAAVLLVAAIGAGRLVPADRLLPRLIAAVGYAWTPYLAERLLMGQWGLLLAYAALPWLVSAAVRLRSGDRRALLALTVAGAVSAVTPTGGLIALAATVVLVPRRSQWRIGIVATGLVALCNAPWLIASMLTAADGRSDPAGVAAFAARGADWTGPLGALAGTGGIWNAQATLPSRTSVLAPAGTVLLLALAVHGWPRLRERWPDGLAARLLILAGGGFLVSAWGVLPGLRGGLEWLVANVGGAGVLRDGQKFLIPYALLLCVGAALGAERIGRRPVLIGALLLPLVVMPDLAYGGAGRLRPVQYPADWEVVAARIAQEPGEVLSLPFAGYHTYPWNPGRTVIDPLPRYLDADVLVDDRLIVGDLVVRGENARAEQVRALLRAGAPVAGPGVRWVVIQRVVGGAEVPPGALAGLRLVHAGSDLQLYENGSSQRSY